MGNTRNEIIVDNINISDQEIQDIIKNCIRICEKDDSTSFRISISSLSQDLKEKFLIYLLRNFETIEYPIYITEEMERERIIEKWKNMQPKLSERLNQVLKNLYGKENVSMLDIYTEFVPGCFSKPEYYQEFYNLFPDSVDIGVYQKACVSTGLSFNNIESFNSFYRNKKGRTYTNEKPVISINESEAENLDKIKLPPYIDTIAIHMQNINSIPVEKLEVLSQKVNLELYVTVENEIENIAGYGKIKKYYYTFEDFKKIKEKIGEIVEDIDPKESQLVKFLKVYKKLGKLIDYDYDNDGEANVRDEAHNLKGALIEGRCVCEGYSLALKQVLESLDINCKCISGFNHVWNQVEIDGAWYNCDLTCDASAIKENRQPDYCLKSDDEFINHNTKCSWRETCNESYSFVNQANRLVSGNFNEEYLRRELQYLCRRENLPSFQKELEIFKKAFEKLGLDFEKDYEIERYKIELDRLILDWGVEIPKRFENEMSQKLEKLGLDFGDEREKTKKRHYFRRQLWSSIMIKDPKEISKLQKECIDLGLNWDYEMYLQDTTKKPIAIYIEDEIESMVQYISKSDVDRVQRQLVQMGKNITLIDNEEERVD